MNIGHDAQEPIPAGDYKVTRYGANKHYVTYKIAEGMYEGRLLTVPTHMVPDLILTVSIEEEVTTTTRNVAWFKRPDTSDPWDR